MKGRSKQFPKAKPYTDRHGKTRWRIREKGFSAEMGADFGSDEFSRRYADAMIGRKVKPGAGANTVIPRSIDDLVAQFYALHFPNLEDITKRDYRAVIEPLRLAHGKKSVKALQIRHVLAIKAGLHKTPAQANKTLKRLSQLMDLAIKLEWRTDNPVEFVDKFQTSSRGYHTWDEGEISQFYSKHELGSAAYLAITLLLYTGASRADACRLGVHSLNNGRISYRRNKTKKSPNGILVDIPIHSKLSEALKTVPAGAFTFLQTDKGKARSPDGFGNSMAKWTKAAGLSNCSAHGLRKAICRRLAEAGCTPHEIMSVSGHITLSEAQRYSQEFGRKDLSDSAIHKLENGPISEQKLTNHPKRFAKINVNQLKRNN